MKNRPTVKKTTAKAHKTREEAVQSKLDLANRLLEKADFSTLNHKLGNK